MDFLRRGEQFSHPFHCVDSGPQVDFRKLVPEFFRTVPLVQTAGHDDLPSGLFFFPADCLSNLSDGLFSCGFNKCAGIDQQQIGLVRVPGDSESAAEEGACRNFRVDKIFRTSEADNADHPRCLFPSFQSGLLFP